MKYGPAIEQIDELFGNSAFGHFILFNALNILLPRSWHLRRELKIWQKKTSKNHQHILDSGSGLGQYSYMLAGINKSWSVQGVDISGKLVGHCNKVFRKLRKENVLFKVADLTEGCTKESFDLVLGMDIAEYVEEDEKMFRNFHESLREDGALLLYVHLIDEKNPRKRGARMKLVEEQVRNGYTTKDIKKKLKAGGFQRIKIRYVFGPAGHLSWQLSVLYPLALLNVSFLGFILLPFYYLLLLPVILVLNYVETRTGHLTGSAMFVKAYK